MSEYGKHCCRFGSVVEQWRLSLAPVWDIFSVHFTHTHFLAIKIPTGLTLLVQWKPGWMITRSYFTCIDQILGYVNISLAS